MLENGYENIWVLDISEFALERAKKRLGKKANKVHWIVSDITEFETNIKFDFWHDRAVFHFLTEEELQKKPPYTHLTIIATGEAYLGYTPQVNAKKLYNPLEDSFDLTEFKKIQRGIN